MELEYEAVAQDAGTWRDMARNHRVTTDHFWDLLCSLVEERDPPADKLLAFFRGYVLHAGLSLELASKAVLKRQDPETTYRSHDLMFLVPKALNEKLTVAEQDMVQRYTEAIGWFARYPVPLTAPEYESATQQAVSNVDRVCFNSLVERLLTHSK